MENSAGKQFGRYEIVAEVGRGAMGVVYKARDPQIDRWVALKTVRLNGQDPEEEAEFRQRFVNEAQAAGRLHHPGIVAVFDVGEEHENQNPYIVLEYVSGEPLSKILSRERKLPLPKALQLAQEIAEALDYAHGQGVIHRDIKPSNILVTQAGRAKVADFGIAKLNLAHFTVPGKVLGTPAYMAPEQLCGEGVDGRSDLFSLGVILYVMVTGYSPFQGDSATTVCFKVANREPVPASALELNLPEQLDTIISRAMAKDPRDRYQRGSELVEALRQMESQMASRSPSNRGVATPKEATERLHSAIRKASRRDLIVGAATIILLLILAVPSRRLVFGHEDPVVPTRVTSDPQPYTKAPVPTNAVPNSTPVKNSSAGSHNTGSATKVPANAPVVPPVVDITAPSSVDLAVRHQFKDATLFVSIDGRPALTRPLRGGAQKRLILFNGVRGNESETFDVPTGRHVLRVRAETADHTTNLSKSITGEFVGGARKTLQVTFGKHNTVMQVQWEK